MPITKTAKRALRSSNRKKLVNQRIKTKLQAALRLAKRDRTKKSILNAISASDLAAKKNVIHKNKAARLKSMLAKQSLTKEKSLPQKGKPKQK